MIVTLGTGNSFATYRNNTSLMVSRKFLLDCGPTVPRQLPNWVVPGATMDSLDSIFISHLHGDHIYGLETIGFLSLFVWHRRLKLYVPEELFGDLSSILLPTMSYLQMPNGGPVVASSLDTFFDVRIVLSEGWEEIDSDPNWHYRFSPVDHVVGVPAFSIHLSTPGDTSKSADGVSIFYSGDTRAPVVKDLLMTPKPWSPYPHWGGRRFIFHDAALVDFGPASVHCPIEKLVAEVDSLKDELSNVEVYAIHVSDGFSDDLLDGTNIKLAEDGVSLP